MQHVEYISHNTFEMLSIEVGKMEAWADSEGIKYLADFYIYSDARAKLTCRVLMKILDDICDEIQNIEQFKDDKSFDNGYCDDDKEDFISLMTDICDELIPTVKSNIERHKICMMCGRALSVWKNDESLFKKAADYYAYAASFALMTTCNKHLCKVAIREINERGLNSRWTLMRESILREARKYEY